MSNLIKFLNREIPFYFIVEVADAHYGSMERAKRMIEKSVASGAQAVKFQHHIPDAEMLPEIPMSKNMAEPLYEFLLKNAISIEQHVELSDFCKSQNIDYLCTPFSYKAAQELKEFIDPIAYKIGSGELLDHPTIIKIMEFNKPMIISTGMSTEDEIKLTYDLFKNYKNALVLMNCTSAYPPKMEEVHVSYVSSMKKHFPKAIVGHSDHTPGIETTLASYVLGATVFEKHLTDDEKLSGPDQSVSINFEKLTELILMLNNLSLALKAPKQIHQNEIEIRAWAHRSLVYNRNLNSGETIKVGDIWGKRPGTGIPSRFLEIYIGKELTKNVATNTLLKKEDFE
jgi:N,N'-diacetyllegionaminate synthase